jgi:hypothetical protein
VLRRGPSLLLSRIGKKTFETSHGVSLNVGQHVGVHVHGDVYARVAEDLLEDLDGFSGLEPIGEASLWIFTLVALPTAFSTRFIAASSLRVSMSFYESQ